MNVPVTRRTTGRRARLSSRVVGIGLASLVAFGLATFAEINALANVTRASNPAFAVRLAPQDSLALGLLADQRLSQAPDNVAVRAQASALARRALSQSLLTATALRVLAIDLSAKGDERRLLALLNASQQVSRRDTATQLLLIEAQVARNNAPGALAAYDTLLRSNISYGATLFPILANGATDRELRPAIVARVRKAPWSGAFIDWATETPGAAMSIWPVLAAAQPGPDGMSEGRRQNLIKALADKGGYEPAVKLYRAWGGVAEVSQLSAVDWARAPRFAPIDWEAQDGAGFISAFTPGRDARLEVRAEADVSAPALRRFVTLAPGVYRLAARARAVDDDQLRLTANVTCAAGGGSIARLPIDTRAAFAGATILTVPTQCAVQWLSIDFTSSESGEAQAGVLDLLTITPATSAANPGKSVP